MTDKADIIVWEKDTETNEIKKVTLKQIVGIVNNQNAMEETPYEYYVNRRDIKWKNIAKVRSDIPMIQQTGNVDQKKTEEIKLELFKPIVMAMVIFVH